MPFSRRPRPRPPRTIHPEDLIDPAGMYDFRNWPGGGVHVRGVTGPYLLLERRGPSTSGQKVSVYKTTGQYVSMDTGSGLPAIGYRPMHTLTVNPEAKLNPANMQRLIDYQVKKLRRGGAILRPPQEKIARGTYQTQQLVDEMTRKIRKNLTVNAINNPAWGEKERTYAKLMKRKLNITRKTSPLGYYFAERSLFPTIPRIKRTYKPLLGRKPHGRLAAARYLKKKAQEVPQRSVVQQIIRKLLKIR